MKRIVIIIAAALVLCSAVFVIINITGNNKKVEKKDTYNKVGSEEIVYSGLDDIRKNGDKVVGSLENGEYANISGEDVILTITQADNVCCINTDKADLIGKDKLEILEKEREILEYSLGEGLVESNFYDDVSSLNYQEAKSAIEAGTYKATYGRTVDIPFLGYTLEAEILKRAEDNGEINLTPEEQQELYGEGDYKYGHVDPNCAMVWIDKGKIHGMWQGSHDAADQYHISQIDREKEIELSNGKITLGDAVDFVEDYFETKLPYEVNKDVKKKVQGVSVTKISNNINEIRFRLVRMYNGMLFEGAVEGATYNEIPKYARDICYAEMIDTDDIDIYYGVTSALKVEREGEEADECVTPESALRLVSQSIGSNSEYMVKSIESIYRLKKIDEEKEQYYGTPCWKIFGTNTTSGQEISFYVNMISGELDYEEGERKFDESAFTE